jgi:hypothetical protein
MEARIFAGQELVNRGVEWNSSSLQSIQGFLMGSRATYYLIENGEVTISSSKWGAHSVDALLLGGIEGVRPYFEPPDASYAYSDEIMCEGGFVIDKDRRILRMFGGETAGLYVSLRRAYLGLLRFSWPNWDIDWAYDGIDELGEFAFGVRRGVIDQPSLAIMAGVWQKTRPIAEREPLYDPELARGEDVVILSFLRENGACIDYVVPSDNGFETLGLGPELENHLENRFLCDLPTEEHDLILRGGAIIEPARKHINVWFDRSSPMGLHFLAERWAGWTLVRQNKGLAWHAERTGRDPERHGLSLPIAIARILTKLDEYRVFRNHPGVRGILAGVNEADEAYCLAKHVDMFPPLG